MLERPTAPSVRSTVGATVAASIAAIKPAAPLPTTTTSALFRRHGGAIVLTGLPPVAAGAEDGCWLAPADHILPPVSEPARYSIVVPCFNSGPWIDELVRRVGETMSSIAGGHELILVNDDSTDPETWPAIRKQAEAVAWVRAVDLMANVGQFRALMCGMELARGEFVVTMDDDLQHPPEEVPEADRSDRGRSRTRGRDRRLRVERAFLRSQPRDTDRLVDLRPGVRQARLGSRPRAFASCGGRWSTRSWPTAQLDR